MVWVCVLAATLAAVSVTLVFLLDAYLEGDLNRYRERVRQWTQTRRREALFRSWGITNQPGEETGSVKIERPHYHRRGLGSTPSMSLRRGQDGKNLHPGPGPKTSVYRN